MSYIYLLVISRSTIRISVGTSDSTVILSTETDITNRLMLARQRRLLNLRTRIAQLEEELAALEECSDLHDDG